MLAKERLLDLVENFILFDDSRAGRHAQDRGPQPSGARRQQRGRVGRAAGGAEAASSRRSERLIEYRGAEAGAAEGRRSAAAGLSAMPDAASAGERRSTTICRW